MAHVAGLEALEGLGRTLVMGVVNVTPDSFSGDGIADGGVSAALERCRRMLDEGADLLDLGGESTRPGHDPVGPEEELRRVSPVLRAVRAAFPDVPLSVDTRKRQVAARALDAGADLLNDVTGVTGDGSMAALAAERGVPYILMHDHPLATPITKPR